MEASFSPLMRNPLVSSDADRWGYTLASKRVLLDWQIAAQIFVLGATANATKRENDFLTSVTVRSYPREMWVIKVAIGAMVVNRTVIDKFTAWMYRRTHRYLFSFERRSVERNKNST